MPRFALHFHKTTESFGREDHWDLMLQREGSNISDLESRCLETWALDQEPGPGVVANALKLEDHRAHYLFHDGVLGNDRGRVTMLLMGSYTFEASAAGLRTLVLSSDDRRLRLEFLESDEITEIRFSQVD